MPFVTTSNCPTRLRCIVAATITIALSVASGCGTVSSVTPGAGTDVFEEDGDPSVAALDYVADELLVQPFPGVDAETLRDAYTRAGATVIDTIDELDLTVLRVGPASLESAAAFLSDESAFETIQKNYLLQAQISPDDTLYEQQNYLDTIRASEAWNISTGDEDIIIAIVDTGVDPDHVDLADKIQSGWNIWNDNADFSDSAGHGTLVSGVAAALSDNGLGVTGMSWGSPILAVRVADASGQTTSRHVATGILWAVNHGADVINVSFAPLWSNRIIRSAAQTALLRDCIVVISAGNGGGRTSSRGFPEALFVGALNENRTIASFSDQGPFVDIVAPGTSIRSTRVGGTYGLTNGTSFAAPLVAGVAALAWSSNPDLRPVSIMTALTEHAVDLGGRGKDSAYGHGLLDAAATVAAAAKSAVIPDTVAPSVFVESPADGDRLGKKTVIAISAEDKSGVADVTMSVDGIVVAVDTRSSYRVLLDPGRFDAGAHELSFVATDVVGNRSNPFTIHVTFGEVVPSAPATVVFTNPREGSAVSGGVSIEATVTLRRRAGDCGVADRRRIGVLLGRLRGRIRRELLLAQRQLRLRTAHDHPGRHRRPRQPHHRRTLSEFGLTTLAGCRRSNRGGGTRGHVCRFCHGSKG